METASVAQLVADKASRIVRDNYHVGDVQGQAAKGLIEAYVGLCTKYDQLINPDQLRPELLSRARDTLTQNEREVERSGLVSEALETVLDVLQRAYNEVRREREAVCV